MGFFKKLRGTAEQYFQFGLGNPQIKGDPAGPTLDVRNKTDTLYARMRGALPTTADDFVTKAYADALKNGVGLASARPAATGSGAIYVCTDIPVAYLDDPSSTSWKPIGVAATPVGGNSPPAAGAFTLVGGGLALNNYANALRVTKITDGNSVGDVALIAGSLGSGATWIVELEASLMNPYFRNYGEIGVLVTNGTTSGTSDGYTIASFGNVGNIQGYFGIHQEKIKVGAAARSAVNNEGADARGSYNLASRIRLRLLADGTNLHYQYSGDGFHWMDQYAEATPAGLTHYGLVQGNDFTGSNSYCVSLVYGLALRALTQPQLTVSTVSNTSPAEVTTTANHNLQDGDMVAIHGVVGTTSVNTGTGAAAYNSSSLFIQVTAANKFKTIGVNGNAAYVSGGNVTLTSR
jgi:hypothetical protein